jgi:hypothetical protein
LQQPCSKRLHFLTAYGRVCPPGRTGAIPHQDRNLALLLTILFGWIAPLVNRRSGVRDPSPASNNYLQIDAFWVGVLTIAARRATGAISAAQVPREPVFRSAVRT